ncbi:M23 family metallopeptidase [Faecalispora anaeroviscerum]|uniref:M23 family metallopeptidase n=1 Tax=Faecalispora anaeroviscerum TaxID=2991836 RepID=UPI0024B9FB23|nr:M23 family metallopeptidase [Faecalispora anaeroviscerum]
MSSLHFKSENQSPKKNNKGFYVALGVCLVAVGVAAWTTYDSVVKYANPQDTSSYSASPTGRTQSGVYASSKPTEASSQPQSSEVESTAPSSSKPAASSQAPDKAASSKAEQPAKQTAAKPASYVYPVGETVTKNYSGDNPIFSDTMQDWRVHSGTDYEAKIGDPVKAIDSGKVTELYANGNLGNVVVIEHSDGITAYYCGMGDTFLVKKGDTVNAGQKIGSINVVPIESVEKPHLHLEIKKSGKLIDPATLLK